MRGVGVVDLHGITGKSATPVDNTIEFEREIHRGAPDCDPCKSHAKHTIVCQTGAMDCKQHRFLRDSRVRAWRDGSTDTYLRLKPKEQGLLGSTWFNPTSQMNESSFCHKNYTVTHGSAGIAMDRELCSVEKDDR